MGQIACQYGPAQTVASGHSVTGSKAMVGSNAVILVDIRADQNAYPLGWCGGALRFSFALSGGSTDSSIDIWAYKAFSNSTSAAFYDGVAYYTKSFSTSQLTQSGTSVWTYNVLTREAGSSLIIHAQRTAGDRTISMGLYLRRLMLVHAG